MSQFSDSHPSPPPSIAAPAGYQPPMRPQVVHVVGKPGGLWRAMAIVAGLLLFLIVFIIGLVFGIAGTMAASKQERLVFHEQYRDGRQSEIAIIPVEGPIDREQARFVRAAVDDVLQARTRPSAVVLRVDSPGGEVTASDEIWYEVERLKKSNLPVIASYGGVAASGGYYISCGADHIMAQDTTITGSIGVIAQMMTFENLMDKVGVQPVTLVATGSPEKSVANDIFRTWDERDKQKIRIMLDAAYATFAQRVHAGRKNVISNVDVMHTVANGSIYTAQQAKDNGLIDAIGYLDDAIAVAETRAGVPVGMSKVYMIRKPVTLMSALMGANASDGGLAVRSLNGDAVRSFVNDLATPRMMYLMQ